MPDDNNTSPPQKRKTLGVADLKLGKVEGELSEARLAELRKQREAMAAPLPENRVSSRRYLASKQQSLPAHERDIALLDVVWCSPMLKRYTPTGELLEEQKHGRPALVVGIEDQQGALAVIPFTHAQVDRVEGVDTLIQHSLSARHVKIDDLDMHAGLFGNHNVPSYLLLQQRQSVIRESVTGHREVPDTVKQRLNHMIAREGYGSILPIKPTRYGQIEQEPTPRSDIQTSDLDKDSGGRE